MSQSSRTHPDIELDALRRSVAGNLVLPGDQDYQRSARTLTVQGSPAVVIACTSPEDIAAALRYAREQELPVAIRSGGHHLAGFGTNNGGVVLDVRALDQVQIFSERPQRGATVRIGTGATWGTVADALAPAGLAISSGDTATVGVGGLLGGGGIGWMVRRDGLAIDAVTAAELVTADGSLHRVEASTEPDLFWGVRGAAGNLGVVTAYEVTAVHQPRVLFGSLLFPAGQARQVLTGWADYLPDAPVELTAGFVLPPGMMADGQAPVMINVCFSGDPADAESVLAPLRSLGTVIKDTVAPMPYAEVLSTESMPPDWVPRIRNGLFAGWSSRQTDALLDGHDQIRPMAIEIRAIGGALGQVDPIATAFAHRSAQFMINTVLIGTPAAQEPQLPAFTELWGRLTPDGSYVNFLSHPTAADRDLCYPEPTRSRLAGVKATYDPANVFSSTVNVPPAGPAAAEHR
ncbi:MAG TPA: FAD-binding oxidoreductase [Microlunatus sp.]